MTDHVHPVTPLFEIQRWLIKESQQLLTRSVETQQLTNRLLLNGLENQEVIQCHGINRANTAVHGYLNGTTAALSVGNTADRMHDLVDEQFDWMLGIHTDAFGAFKCQFERNIDTYEDFSTEHVESADDQLDSLLDTHHQFETQTIELVEDDEEQIRVSASTNGESRAVRR